jgi:hypothetical protein
VDSRRAQVGGLHALFLLGFPHSAGIHSGAARHREYLLSLYPIHFFTSIMVVLLGNLQASFYKLVSGSAKGSAVEGVRGGEFGVEGGGGDRALLDEDGFLAEGGQDPDLGSDADDARGADKDKGIGAAIVGSFEAIKLPSPAIARDGYIEDTQALLLGVAHFAGQEDQPGAGRQHRALCLEKSGQGFAQAQATKQLPLSRTLAAWQDQPIKGRKLPGTTHFKDPMSQGEQHLFVRRNATL